MVNESGAIRWITVGAFRLKAETILSLYGTVKNYKDVVSILLDKLRSRISGS